MHNNREQYNGLRYNDDDYYNEDNGDGDADLDYVENLEKGEYENDEEYRETNFYSDKEFQRDIETVKEETEEEVIEFIVKNLSPHLDKILSTSLLWLKEIREYCKKASRNIQRSIQLNLDQIDFNRIAGVVMSVYSKKNKKEENNTTKALKGLGIYESLIMNGSKTLYKDIRTEWLSMLRLLYKQTFFNGDHDRFNNNPRDTSKRIRLYVNYSIEQESLLEKRIIFNFHRAVQHFSNILANELFCGFHVIHQKDKNLTLELPGSEIIKKVIMDYLQNIVKGRKRNQKELIKRRNLSPSDKIEYLKKMKSYRQNTKKKILPGTGEKTYDGFLVEYVDSGKEIEANFLSNENGKNTTINVINNNGSNTVDANKKNKPNKSKKNKRKIKGVIVEENLNDDISENSKFDDNNDDKEKEEKDEDDQNDYDEILDSHSGDANLNNHVNLSDNGIDEFCETNVSIMTPLGNTGYNLIEEAITSDRTKQKGTITKTVNSTSKVLTTPRYTRNNNNNNNVNSSNKNTNNNKYRKLRK